MVPRNRIRNRRPGMGASAVEFAIVAPVFFMIVLGMVEMGRAFMVLEQLTEAARRACRVAVVDGTSSATIKQTAVDYLTGVGIKGETASISINDQPLDTVEAMNTPSYTEITVVITVPVASCTWLPGGLFLSGNLSGQYTMRRE
jgi:Flp pilus assembly protein TadG